MSFPVRLFSNMAKLIYNKPKPSRISIFFPDKPLLANFRGMSLTVLLENRTGKLIQQKFMWTFSKTSRKPHRFTGKPIQ